MTNNILIFEKNPYLRATMAANIANYANLAKKEAPVDVVTNLDDLESRLRRQTYSAVIVTTPEGVKTTREKSGTVPLYFFFDWQQNSSGIVRQALASGATSCIYKSPLLGVGGGMDRLLENIFNP